MFLWGVLGVRSERPKYQLSKLMGLTWADGPERSCRGGYLKRSPVAVAYVLKPELAEAGAVFVSR